MPLHKLEWLDDHRGWAVWRITESIDELTSMALPDVCPPDVTHATKRLEWMAGRILIRYMVETSGKEYTGIIKDEFGKPYLRQASDHISLSHDYPFVAAQFDSMHPVGIDIEQPKVKLLKIAPRILTDTERNDAANDLAKNCVYWCAKEALYKIYGKRKLSFSGHLEIIPFELSEQGDIVGKIAVGGRVTLYPLGYLITPVFVLVFSKGDAVSAGV